jgi:hypothetical protein
MRLLESDSAAERVAATDLLLAFIMAVAIFVENQKH